MNLQLEINSARKRGPGTSTKNVTRNCVRQGEAPLDLNFQEFREGNTMDPNMFGMFRPFPERSYRDHKNKMME